jgi:CRP-like cAMP-binding protein
VAQKLASADETFFDKHLRQISLLAGLSRPQLDAVRKRLMAARYRAGEVVFQQDDQPDGLYLIERGQVQIEKTSAQEVALVAVLGDGDVFGEGALLLEGPRSSTARAVTDLDAWVLRREDFEDLMLQYPVLALNLSRVLEERLRATTDQMRTTGGRGAAAPAPRAAASATAVAARPARAPASAATAAAAPGGLRGAVGNAVQWFENAGAGTKVLVIVLAALLIYLCGVALPYALFIKPVAAAEAAASSLALAGELPARGGLDTVEPAAVEPDFASRGVALALADSEFAPTPHLHAVAHPDAGAQRHAHGDADPHRHPRANGHARADSHLDAGADQHPRAGDRAAGGGGCARACGRGGSQGRGRAGPLGGVAAGLGSPAQRL